jgi:chromosome partitioning protein
MPVVAVINRKGGSGKSTLASHIAAWCAVTGWPVMLGDTDRQQSSRAWLRRRAPDRPAIVGWVADQKNVMRAPPGVSHVVLDTPGGIHGLELAKVVMHADAVLMPIGPSVFDRESAQDCLIELRGLPRITSGKCRLAAVGMRLDARTRAAKITADWAAAQGLHYLGALREAQVYVRSIERGLTVFDLPEHLTAEDRAQWAPILQWLLPVLSPPKLSERPAPAEPVVRELREDTWLQTPAAVSVAARPGLLSQRGADRPAERPLLRAPAAPVLTRAQTPGKDQDLLTAIQVPQFLRKPPPAV